MANVRGPNKCFPCNGSGKITIRTYKGTKKVCFGRCGGDWDYPTHRIEETCPTCKGTGREKKPLCFITTATCSIENKADDCYELEILRKFRDEYLDKNYPNEVEEYYKISPKIVRLINNSNRKEEIYTEIRKEINDCIFFIENQEYEMGFQTYGKMFLKLKSDFSL